MSTTEPTTVDSSSESTTQCRAFVWPFGNNNRAVVMHTDPNATSITEFRLNGETEEEKLVEMRRWVTAHQGFDLAVIDEPASEGDWAPEGTKIVGITFTINAPSGWDWWPTVRSI